MIDELQIDVSVRCDRPGIQLLARVVLPRSIDAETGRPREILVRGPELEHPGRWERLRLGQLPDRLEDQLRVLRSLTGARIDGRESFVNGVILDVYSGPGSLRLEIEPPVLRGYTPAAAAPFLPLLPTATTPAHHVVTVQGGVMEVDGQPFFARVIEEHAEDWNYLKSLGFNTVLLQRPLQVIDLERARQANLWLVAPLPTLDQWSSIREHCDRVLAWNVCGVAADTLRILRRNGLSRPTVSHFHEDHGQLAANEIGLQPPPSWSSPDIAPAPRHGASWYTVPIAPAGGLNLQLRAFGCDPSQLVPERDQLAVMSCLAIARGGRGLVFRGVGRLDATSSAAQLRALTLKQLNEMLLMFDPWFADGVVKHSLDTQDDHLTAVELSKPAGRLAMLIRCEPGDCCVSGPVPEDAVSVSWHGIVETNGLFVVRSSSMMPLSKRPEIVHGKLLFPELDRVNFVVATYSDYATQQVLRRWNAGQISRLCDELSWLDLFVETTKADLSRLSASCPGLEAEKAEVDQAEAEATRARHRLQSAEWQRCRNHLRAAERQLLTARKQCWDRLAGAAPASYCGLATHFDTLDQYVRLCRCAGPAGPGFNLLPTGDCEDQQQMLSAGWRIVSSLPADDNGAGPVVKAGVASEVVHGGRGSLKLAAAPPRLSRKPLRPPSRVTAISPPLAAAKGRLVQIEGWLRVDPWGADTEPRLIVFDSSGGPELAFHCPAGKVWQPFQLVRMADDGDPLTIHFELSGFGTAHIDDVTVSRLETGETR